MEDLNLIVKATLQMYLECAVQASKWLAKNWLVLLASVALFLLFTMSIRLFGGLGLAGGFLLGFISALLTAQYYSWLQSTVDKDRLRLEDFYQIDWPMFISVISVGFLLYLLHWVVSGIAAGMSDRSVILIFYLLIVFAFNAIPEVIYIKRLESVNAFGEALRFTKENWIEWYIPFIILLLPSLIFNPSPVSVLLQFALISPLFPGVMLIGAWSQLFREVPQLGLVIGFIIAHWYMIFRGFLFRDLEGGTRRRRIYLAKQK